MDERLKQLFDYTKFHIGMYTTLIAGIIGIFANDKLKLVYFGMVPYIKWTIGFFFVAGIAGGLVASSIPFSETFKDFSESRLGPWKLKVVPAIICTHIEHTAFWLGIIVAVVGLFKVL
jgi:hypothetical protein